MPTHAHLCKCLAEWSFELRCRRLFVKTSEMVQRIFALLVDCSSLLCLMGGRLWWVLAKSVYIYVFCSHSLYVCVAKWVEHISVFVRLRVQSWVMTLFNLLTGHTLMYKQCYV